MELEKATCLHLDDESFGLDTETDCCLWNPRNATKLHFYIVNCNNYPTAKIKAKPNEHQIQACEYKQCLNACNVFIYNPSWYTHIYVCMYIYTYIFVVYFYFYFCVTSGLFFIIRTVSDVNNDILFYSILIPDLFRKK